MTITGFDDLLHEAALQLTPQRMLFVFAKKGMPEGVPAEELESFYNGMGGTLEPVVCVDKAVSDLGNFSHLSREAKATGVQWDIVFVGCLDGQGGLPPEDSDIIKNLDMMIDAIKTGDRLSRFLAFDRNGDILQITA